MDHYLQNEKLVLMAKVFPRVRKLMHKHQPCRLKLSSADLVAFNDGTNAPPTRVTFTGFLYSYSSCFSADICLSGSRNFN